MSSKEFQKIIVEELLDDETHKLHSREFVIDQNDVIAIRVFAQDYGVIEEGRQGAGNRAWLFIDEIVVR